MTFELETVPTTAVWCLLLLAVMTGSASGSPFDNAPRDRSPRFRMLTNAESWKRLPAARSGQGQPLPSWARMLVDELPATTAALLQLDLAQRTAGPIPPRLRAAMRWVAAHLNGSDYAAACALADARRAGATEQQLGALGQPDPAGWTAAEQAALRFAQQMTVDSAGVTDEQFAHLVSQFGEHQAASMVLLMAYANFQDRLLLCLDAPLESADGWNPVAVAFAPESLVIPTTPPPAKPGITTLANPGVDLVTDDADWTAVDYETLQQRLEQQRRRPTRLRVPSWDEVARKLPPGLFSGPSDIVWYRIVFGYAPELAVPFELLLRTAGAEARPKWDRILGGGLFWVTTKGVDCPYCMGHCEMNWEVAGLSPQEIALRSRTLAGDDWSSFPPAEQRAYAFVRRLTKSPREISAADVRQLQDDFGSDKALILVLNASRYHYMTRVSNGFQLTLERENVFYDYYNVNRPSGARGQPGDPPSVPLLSEQECWERLPRVVSGGQGPLPNWVRGVAEHLPRTAAAMLQLDFAHRVRTPLDPVLRAKQRWVIAEANRCEYSRQYALADLRRAGVADADLQLLTGSPEQWPADDREPLEFARLLTVAAPTIEDALFARLRERFGDQRVAAMVLLAAYGNFQDRLILGLNLPLEDQGPLAPLDVRFADDALQIAPFLPGDSPLESPGEPGLAVVANDPDWGSVSYGELQTRLEKQRDRQPRLPIPAWDDVRQRIPAEMAARPTRIVWNLVCAGYVPELAVPWSIATRTMWAESKPDRVFEESLFWVQTRAIECNYCMGHCEMLLEVAGLDQGAIADRTRRLAAADWSSFPPVEQRAYQYARKLSREPWNLTVADYRLLETDLGRARAMATFWWLCRGLYMTRVSDGFQLPLERDNVFQSVPQTPPATQNRPR